jgi:hypothetical protein
VTGIRERRRKQLLRNLNEINQTILGGESGSTRSHSVENQKAIYLLQDGLQDDRWLFLGSNTHMENNNF